MNDIEHNILARLVEGPIPAGDRKSRAVLRLEEAGLVEIIDNDGGLQLALTAAGRLLADKD